MTTYGLTPTGFVKKPREVIRAELEADYRASLGADVDTAPGSVLGALLDAKTTQFAEQWDLVEAVYRSRSPKTASNAALTELAALTGTVRRGAERGRVKLRLRLAPGANVPAGSTAAVNGDPSNLWRTVAAASNFGASETSADVVAESVTPGAFAAPANTITRIMSPAAGWLSVTNLEDAEVGRGVESDAELVARQELEVSMPGTATVPAIRADLLNPARSITPENSTLTAEEIALAASLIDDVRVETNRSAWPDALGRPGHSVEAIIRFGRVADAGQLAIVRAMVGAVLVRSTAAGVQWFGSQSAVFTDRDGAPVTVRWSETTTVPVRVDVVFPPGIGRPSSEAIREAVLAYGATLRIGSPVMLSAIVAAIVKLPGFVDLTEVRCGRDLRREFTADPASDLIAFDGTSLANGTAVTLANFGGALPSPLVPGVPYYVRDSAPGQCGLAGAPGGGAINLTDAGTGTHVFYLASGTTRSNLTPSSREVAVFDSGRVFILDA